jgi:hypothetical protein
VINTYLWLTKVPKILIRMKVCYSLAILGVLRTTALGAAIIRPSSTFYTRESLPTGPFSTVLLPTGALPTDTFAPVRRQEHNNPNPAATSPFPFAPGDPSSTPGANGGSLGGGPFIAYSGPSSSFPPISQWVSFETLWSRSAPEMQAAGNSDSENSLIKSAILTVSTSCGVDSRAILATIMQESGGNVRVTSTHNGVGNPGLMQSHAGMNFNPADPEGSILQMVRDGAEGTSSGDGLKQTLAAQNGDYYEAFRKYNSGSVNRAELNDGMGATALYVQQMANRLMGAVSFTG